MIASLLSLVSSVLAWFTGKRSAANQPAVVQAREAQNEQDETDRVNALMRRAMAGDKAAKAELERL